MRVGVDGADGVEGGGELAHRNQPAFRAVEIGTTFFSSTCFSSAFLPAIGSSISPCPGTLGLAFFAFAGFSAAGGALGAFACFSAFSSRSDSARLCRKASNKLTTLRGRSDRLHGLRRQAGLLLVQHFDHGLFVAINEFGRVELRFLGLQNVLCERQQVRFDLHVGDVVEIILRVAHLVGVAQRHPEQPVFPGLQHDHALALGEHDAAERDHVFAAHRLADDGEGLLADRFVRRDVIGAVEEAFVDLAARHEQVDFDRVVALDLDRVELVILDHEVRALRIFVAPALVCRLDGVTGVFVDQLLAKPVAGLLVDLAKRHAFARRRRRPEADRAGDEGELDIALPIGTTGRHAALLYATKRSNLAGDSHESIAARQ